MTSEIQEQQTTGEERECQLGSLCDPVMKPKAPGGGIFKSFCISGERGDDSACFYFSFSATSEIIRKLRVSLTFYPGL